MGNPMDDMPVSASSSLISLFEVLSETEMHLLINILSTRMPNIKPDFSENVTGYMVLGFLDDYGLLHPDWKMIIHNWKRLFERMEEISVIKINNE